MYNKDADASLFYFGEYMAFVILEGIDRTGKSTVAELYKEKGFEVVHMSAPDKKYSKEGYVGPSYLDVLVEQLISYSGKDVIFDRSWYGELVWPHVYGRKPALSIEDIEILREIEDQNGAQRILMIDPDTEGHWKRCVDNKEPLNINQFKIAATLYNKLAHQHNFMPSELKDFKSVDTKDTDKEVKDLAKSESPAIQEDRVLDTSPVVSDRSKDKKKDSEDDAEMEKLEKANAIKTVLTSRIIKKKGAAFDKLESDLKEFLKSQLSEIFNPSIKDEDFTADEKLILRTYCKRMKEKLNG